MKARPLDIFVRRICESGAKAVVEGGEAVVQRNGREIWRGHGYVLVQAVRDGLAVQLMGEVAWAATPKAREHLKCLGRDRKVIMGFRPGVPRLESGRGAYARPATAPIRYRPRPEAVPDEEPR